jgi:hypothetical protein
VQQIEIVGAPVQPSFNLWFGLDHTDLLEPNASAAEIEAALEGLPSIGAGNVSVTGDRGGPWTVEFVGDLALEDVSQIGKESGPLGDAVHYNYTLGLLENISYSHNGGADALVEFSRDTRPVTQVRRYAEGVEDPVVTDIGYDLIGRVTSIAYSYAAYDVEVETPGVDPVNEIQRVSLDGFPTTGSISLLVMSEPVEWELDATSGEVEDLLEDLDAIDPGDVIVTGNPGNWSIEFAGQFAAQNIPLITVDDSTLDGAWIAHDTLTAGGTGQNEIQTVTLNDTFAGQFTLTFGA